MPGYTQVMPVFKCSDYEQLKSIMVSCGLARALTYNKLGSIAGWGLNWKKADPIIRKIIHPSQLGVPSKLFEWSVSDCFKAIKAQQEAAKTFIIRKIYQKYCSQEDRQRLIELLKNNPTANNWLHRHFRKQYLRGHTYLSTWTKKQNCLRRSPFGAAPPSPNSFEPSLQMLRQFCFFMSDHLDAFSLVPTLMMLLRDFRVNKTPP